jgi:transcription antitermination factor NusG
MKRIDENPPQRFPDKPITESAGTWWVVKLRPRMEKAMAFDLIERNIDYYLPLYTKVSRRRDNNKPRKSVLPLFPGYISLCTDHVSLMELYHTGRIVKSIIIKNQRRFVRDLEQVHVAIDLGVEVHPYPAHNYEVGNVVEVYRGPLRGLQGHVARVDKSERLIVSVEGLGSAVVSVDARCVRFAEETLRRR